uniref:KHA domain-containing protein n=3 Tax=Hemiselmis andersenii TaxID=464988 RepID=A0A6U2AY76_HEMAN|mmetsp:Transcript_5942/g.14338  ORF Transcript_5942/g.14338 Transcript_5942/m.14338 type:complete len:481 (+) Transcript_5942:316-1758(+)
MDIPGMAAESDKVKDDEGIFAHHSAIDDILTAGAPSQNTSSNGTQFTYDNAVSSNDGDSRAGISAPANTRSAGGMYQQRPVGSTRRDSGPGSMARGVPRAGMAHRVSVQDLEGDRNGTVMLLLPATLDDLLIMVSSRFGYKSKYCRLYSRWGAVIEDVTLLKDDDLLFASDGKEFPQGLRAANLPGLDAIDNLHSRGTDNTKLEHLHELERFDIWGWPRIGQIAGAERARARMFQSWRTSGTAGSILFIVNFITFMFPSSCVSGRGICEALVDEQAVRTYFWFFALATLTSLLSVVMAATLTMQLNLLPTNGDVFWFLKEYGNWLVGYPTTFLVLSVTLTFGGVMCSAVINYSVTTDAYALIGVYCFTGVILIVTSLILSTRSWARVNGMALHKVWPEDPYQVNLDRAMSGVSGHTGVTAQHSPSASIQPISNYASNTSSAMSHQGYVNSVATGVNVSSSSPTDTADDNVSSNVAAVRSS